MSNTINPNAIVNRHLNHPAQEQDANKFGQQVGKNGQPIDPSVKAFLNPSNVQDQANISAAMVRQAEQAYGYSQSMSLQLKTREGDTVTIDFRQLYAQYQSYKEAQAGQQDPTGVRYFESREAMEATAFEERFAFSVEGHLNEDELEAVFDVFEKVDKLANNFYDGNIEKALDQAMKMEIDFGQLQGMQLNLTQTEVFVSSQQQAAVAEYAKGSGEESEKSAATVADLPEYLQKWQLALESLDQWFENAEAAWNEMMAGVTAQRFPEQDSPQGWFERIQSFHNQLKEMAQVKNDLSAPAEETIEAEPEEVAASEKVQQNSE